MDDIVKQAMAKWPNVPHCYGWLGLDARGNWYMRDDPSQARGSFASGVAGNNPLDLLQTYRANPRVDGEITFGMNVIVEHGAGRFLHVGDALELEIAF